MKGGPSVISKNVKLLVSVILLVILIICCGCGKTAPEQIPDREPDVVLPLEGEDAYVIVRPEQISKEELALVTELRELITEKTGATVQLKDDFVREGTKFTIGEHELCFGLTNREESQRAYEGLKYNDYRILLDGTKVVIAYGSAEAGKEAVERFAEDYVSAGDKVIAVPQDLSVEVLGEYALDTITIDGRDISKYVIVGEDSFTSTVRDRIAQAAGILLKTAASAKADQLCIKLDTLDDLGTEEAGVRLVDGSIVAGTSGVEYYNESAIPLLLRVLTENGGTLTEKDLNKKEKIVIENKLPFRRGINFKGLDTYPIIDALPGADSPMPVLMASSTYYIGLPETYKEIRAAGFDHVCIYLSMAEYYDAAADSLYTSGAHDIRKLDGVLQKAIDAGLYVMIRCCQNGWEFSADNPDHCRQFVKMWARYAEHYKDWDEKLVFNLQAEVKGEYNTPANFNKLQLETVAAIRRTNPDRWLVLTVADYCMISRLDTFVPPEGDTRYAVAVHTYVPLIFTHQGATWGDPNNTFHVDLTEDHIRQLNDELIRLRAFTQKHPDIPVILNEFGVNQGVASFEDTTEWLTIVRTFCEKHGISWTYWAYCDLPSDKLVRAVAAAMGIDYETEAYKYYGFGARLAYDTEWRAYILKGLGIEVPKK